MGSDVRTSSRGASWRRLIVLVLGLFLTGGAIAWTFSLPGIFLCRAHLVLLAPPTEARPNQLDSNSAGLLATAGVLERKMAFGRTQIPATSPDVTLLDQGVFDGELVRLPNYGGQRAADFRDPVLDVQASASTSAVALKRVQDMVDEAYSELRQMQDEAGVRPSERISLVLSPAQLRVEFHPGQRTRAAAVLLVLGVVGSVGASAAAARGRRVVSISQAV